MGVLAVMNWWGYAAKRYHGPRLDGAHEALEWSM